MKMLVSTKGDFMLVNPQNGEEVRWNRPSVVREATFISEKLSTGVLQLHAATLPDTADDAGWAEWLKASDGNTDLAVASYITSFDPPPPVVEKARLK